MSGCRGEKGHAEKQAGNYCAMSFHVVSPRVGSAKCRVLRLIDVGLVAHKFDAHGHRRVASVLPVPPMSSFKWRDEGAVRLPLRSFDGVAGPCTLHVGPLTMHIDCYITGRLPAEQNSRASSHVGFDLFAFPGSSVIVIASWRSSPLVSDTAAGSSDCPLFAPNAAAAFSAKVVAASDAVEDVGVAGSAAVLPPSARAVRPSALPIPVGSMPYSAGRTVVTRSAPAMAAATRVDFSRRPVVGSG